MFRLGVTGPGYPTLAPCAYPEVLVLQSITSKSIQMATTAVLVFSGRPTHFSKAATQMETIKFGHKTKSSLHAVFYGSQTASNCSFSATKFRNSGGFCMGALGLNGL